LGVLGLFGALGFAVDSMAALGLRMSLPPSSQSIEKSKRTSRVRDTRIEVPITRLHLYWKLETLCSVYFFRYLSVENI